MSTPVLPIEELLAPISEEKPAGDDISLAPEWQVINEARRADKLTGRQNTDWRMLFEVLSDCLAHKAKDLRLGMWLTEATVKLHGFAGLRDSFKILSGLLNNYWDKGLYPEAEDGDLQFRAMPLVWMTGDKLPDAIREIPLTARTDGGKDYSQLDEKTAREVVRSEKSIVNSNGDIDEEKQRRRQSLLAAGAISPELWEEAVRATRRKGIEVVSEVLNEAFAEFKAFDKLLDEKFGNDAPGTSEAREAFESCMGLVKNLVIRKKEEEPDAVAKPEGGEAQGDGQSGRQSVTFDAFAVDGGGGGSWARAEELIREGKIAEGLAEMTRQSAQEYGRVRFQHRLRLAEICLSTTRTRLGLAILEELAKQIDDLKLEMWESPELLGRVWGRLYKSYKGDEDGSDRAVRAAALFDRLCRLDPWQALRWDE